jgi:hypothetical protein
MRSVVQRRARGKVAEGIWSCEAEGPIGIRLPGQSLCQKPSGIDMKSWWTFFKDAAANWSAHKDARQGAALAYYSVFSLGPLMVIAIAIAGLVFGQEAVRGEVGAQLQGLLGETGAQAVQAMLSGASKPAQGVIASILGIGTLLFAAVGVVVQLKDALNTVWEVAPSKEGGVWAFVPHVYRLACWCPGGWVPPSGLPVADNPSFSGGQISRPLSARGCPADRGVPCIIYSDYALIRHDV